MQEESYDFVFSGGAVLSVEGDVFTASGVYLAEKEGEMQPCSKIRMNRGSRVQVFQGHVFTLSSGKLLEATHIQMPEKRGGTGKIYLAYHEKTDE